MCQPLQVGVAWQSEFFFSLYFFFISSLFLLVFPFFLLYFFPYSSLSFDTMKALTSLILGCPLGFHSDLVLQATCSPSNVSSSLGGKSGALCNVLCFGGESFIFPTWHDLSSKAL